MLVLDWLLGIFSVVLLVTLPISLYIMTCIHIAGQGKLELETNVDNKFLGKPTGEIKIN